MVDAFELEVIVNSEQLPATNLIKRAGLFPPTQSPDIFTEPGKF
jgi:hypothetical protein